jgi:arylformamidase
MAKMGKILCNRSLRLAFNEATHSLAPMKHPMLKSFALLVATTCLTSSIFAQGPLIERLRERMAERKGSVDAVELSYGKDPLQKLDYWKPVKAGSPLVIFVHGGGWKRGDKQNATGKEKSKHYLQQGYAFASINYRLVPAATVEQQAQDVANAIAHLISRAESLGFDGKRVVLMGHSAGAHLSALVGTDMKYLNTGRAGAKVATRCHPARWRVLRCAAPDRGRR